MLTVAGDLFALDLSNETMIVQSGSYVASEMGIELDTKWGGAKTFFASEGLIMLRASGSGKLLLSSYGAIHEFNLKAGETQTFDTGHLVAFSDGTGFKVRGVEGSDKSWLSVPKPHLTGWASRDRIVVPDLSDSRFGFATKRC